MEGELVEVIMTQEDKYYVVRSLEKAFFVIETMATRKSWELKELSAACSMPKGTLQRILRTFEDLGYVRQIERGGAYGLTLKFSKLGRQIVSQSNIASLIHPVMLKLRNIVNETVNLGALSGTEVIVIHQNTSSHALQMDSIVGTSFPAYLSASGKVLLAFLAEEELRGFIKELRRSNGGIDSDKINWLYEEIDSIREKGISFDFEELFKGIRCVAAPIFDDSGHIIASISCSVPTVRLDRNLSRKLLQEIPRAAAEASKLLESSPRSFSFDIEEAIEKLVS